MTSHGVILGNLTHIVDRGMSVLVSTTKLCMSGPEKNSAASTLRYILSDTSKCAFAMAV